MTDEVLLVLLEDEFVVYFKCRVEGGKCNGSTTCFEFKRILSYYWFHFIIRYSTSIVDRLAWTLLKRRLVFNHQLFSLIGCVKC